MTNGITHIRGYSIARQWCPVETGEGTNAISGKEVLLKVRNFLECPTMEVDTITVMVALVKVNPTYEIKHIGSIP